MSPHVLIDQHLEAMSHPETPAQHSVLIQQQLNEMMADERITIEEFNHYCGRLNKIFDERKEAA